MHRTCRIFLVGIFATGVSAGGLIAQADGGTVGRTSAHGVYSETQAKRGEELFWNICSECHVEDDFTGPFMQFWNGESVRSLFDEIYSTMPEDNPGGLARAQYVDVISYMFKLNGMPMGEAELNEDDLAAVDVDWRSSYDDVEPVAEDRGGADGDETEVEGDGGGDADGDEAEVEGDGGGDADGDEAEVEGDGDAGAERTTAHGVYNEEQAGRGEDVFWNICAECHVEDDFAGPFMQSWSGAKVKDLLEEIRSTMPEDNPGGLSIARYIDVISFMFQLNGMPTGEEEMEETDIPSIEIDWRASYDDPSLSSVAEPPH